MKTGILAMELLIVESPEKAKLISKFLDSNWVVQSCFGHICDMPPKQMGISTENYIPTFELTPKGIKTLKRLKPLAAKADCVWLASDPDREGEAIAWHLAQHLTAKQFKRITTQSITEQAIIDAIQLPRDIDQNLVNSYLARRSIDRLTGYQVSPPLCQLGDKRLSAGRVQSVAVRLLAEREVEINAFQSIEHYVVKLKFKNDDLEWVAKWDASPFTSNDEPYIVEKSYAETVANINRVAVAMIAKKPRIQDAPAPFITSSIQKMAAVRLELSPKECMNLLQHLYQMGFITYHRTDNPNLSNEDIAAVHQQLLAMDLGNHISPTPNTWDTSSTAQEGHGGIIPTDLTKKSVEISDIRAIRLYQIIRYHSLMSQMKPAETTSTIVTLEAVGDQYRIEGELPIYQAKQFQLLYPGWQLLLKKEYRTKEDLLPELQRYHELVPEKGETIITMTQPPKRYSQAELITSLERKGIGRPSTYHTILDTIQARGYATLNSDKMFEATDSALFIVGALEPHFKFMEIKYTARMEEALDTIAKGQAEYYHIISSANGDLQTGLQLLSGADNNLHSCPDCGTPMQKRVGKHNEFLGCMHYPKCKMVIPLFNGKPTDTDIKTSEYKCPDCGHLLKFIMGKFGAFWGHDKKSRCRRTFRDTSGRPNFKIA
jgi:DNA topoisomerase I